MISLWQLETEKNRLETLLNNNLLRKRERLVTDVQEMTGEERKARHEMNRSELETINSRIKDNNSRFKGMLIRGIGILLPFMMCHSIPNK